MTNLLTRRTALVSVAAVLALVAVAATPQLLGGHVAAAFDSLAGADRGWLALAAGGFLAGFAFTVAAWRAALAGAGGSISARQAAARIGIGSLVNSFAPAKLGDAVKVALCARAIDTPGQLWTTGGVYAALAAARSLVLAGLLVVASVTGAIPLWPVFALCAVVVALVLAGRYSGRLRRHRRIEQALAALGTLERSPRAVATVLGWTVAMVVARVAATAAVAEALGLPRPLLAALLILPALDVASAFPITPGSVGIGSGAVAVALASQGIGMTQALGVGIAIQALETLVSIAVGTSGLVYLAQPSPAVRRWTFRVATIGAATALAAVVGVVLDLLA